MSEILLDLRGLNYPFLTGINTVTLHILRELCDNTRLFDQHNFTTFGINATKIENLKHEFAWLQKLLENPDIKYNTADQIRLKQALFLAKFYLNQVYPVWDKFDIIYQPQPKPVPHLNENQRFITTFHDLSSIKNLNQPSFKHFIQENRLAYQKLVDQASTIIACSYATAYDLVRTLKVPENKIRVIYQALPEWDCLYQKPKVITPQKDQSSQISQNIDNIYLHKYGQKPYFLALSAFEYRKNYHNLILAWHCLKKSNPSIYENYDLVIAGNKVDLKYFNYLKNLIQKLNLNNIYLICDIDSGSKENLLQNCHSVVYTSLYEGFGFPILEAQKYGKAVLTSNVASMPEIAGAGALLVSPLDSFQICEGLVILASDDLYRKKLGQNGLINLKRFSWKEYNLALESMFF